MKTRHYCTFCGAKKNEDKMLEIEYRLLKKSGWICREHASTSADIAHIRTSNENPVFVELFSGSGHISEIAATCGYKTVTIDVESKFNPDIKIDIANLRATMLPGNVDVIWASVPCTVYSILNIPNHWEKISIGWRQYYYVPKTKQAIEALRILTKTILLIKQLNPIFYFIENPRGALRHMPHMKFIPYRRTVSYADYGFDYYKPTDIFTNCQYFKPKEITTAVGQKFDNSIQNLSSAYERSLVPDELIRYLFQSIGFMNTEAVG